MGKIITTDFAGFVLLSHFSDFIDTAKVKFYSVKVNKNKTLTIKFYDSKRKLVKPNESK